MRRLGVELGDFLAVGTENQHRFEVVGRAVFSGLGKAGRTHAELGEGAALLVGPWLALVASNDQVLPEWVSNAALVKSSTSSTDVDALRAALPSFRVMAPTPPGVLRAWPELRFMLRASLLLLGLLAVATLLHALTLSARSHCQETAVLRALGLRSRTARMVTVWQAASLLATAGAAGAVLGAFGGHVAWTLFADRVGIVSPVGLTPAEVGLPLISLLSGASLSVALALRAVRSSTQSIPGHGDGQYDEHLAGRLR